jgi:hypothetical protein
VRYYKPKTCGQCGYLNTVTRYFCEKCKAELPPDPPESAMAVWRRRGMRYGMLALLGMVLSIAAVENGIVAYKGDRIEIRLRRNAPPSLAQDTAIQQDAAIQLDAAIQAEGEQQPDAPPEQPPELAISTSRGAPESLSPPETVAVAPAAPVLPEPDPEYVRPEDSLTLFPIDRKWSDVGGWLVYFNREISACLAEAKQADGTIFLLGLRAPDNDLIVGFSRSQLTTVGETLDFRFDGRRLYNPSVGYLGGASLVVGNYGQGGQLKESIARQIRLSIADGDAALAEISLRGTHATLAKLEECRKEFDDLGNSGASARFALLGDTRCENTPDSGSILETAVEFGNGGHKLTVENGTDHDAIVTVRRASDEKTAFSVLVERQQVETVAGVPDGDYQLQYSSGAGLDGTCRQFRQADIPQAEEALVWNTETTGERVIAITRESAAQPDAAPDLPESGRSVAEAPPSDAAPGGPMAGEPGAANPVQ